MKAPYPSLVVFLRIWTLLFPRAPPTFAARATEYGNEAEKGLFILKVNYITSMGLIPLLP